METLQKYFHWILLSVVAFVLLAFVAFADGSQTPQERAAAELPEVIRIIEETQEARDRNEQARVRKAQLLGCINDNDCAVLSHPMNDSPLPAGTPSAD